MSLLKQFMLGLSTYGEAHRLIARERLWIYIWLPGLINLFLFLLLAWVAWNQSAQWLDAFWEWTGLHTVDWPWLGWVKGVVVFLTALIIRILLLLLYMSIYKYLALILLSPVLALLSERVDGILTGRKYPFSLVRLLSDALRGSLLALRNAFLELTLTLLLYLLALIPFAGLASPFLILLLESYFYGFSMMDYSSERKQISMRERLRYVRKYRAAATANGLGFHLIFLVPILGWIIAPTYAVVAATLTVHHIDHPHAPIRHAR